MEFRRINALPPYAFAAIDALKIESRRNGADVVDLGFGNPDLPPPDLAIEKLCESVRNPRNHRYSASRGIPNLRLAITDLYQRQFGVELDPETQACATIGAKEGFSHLMWVLLGPGDAAGLAGAVCIVVVVVVASRAQWGRYGWRGHCRGRFHIPVAA